MIVAVVFICLVLSKSFLENRTKPKKFTAKASLCLIIPSQVQVTLSFPTTNQPLPSPSGTMFGLQDDDLVLESHIMLRNFVSTLQDVHRHVFNEYKLSRFENNEATCSGSFTVEGLPPHHNLGETYDIEEADLLRTHQRFVEEYIRVMKAVIDDELLYEKSDNFVTSRNPDTDSFTTIKNWLERVQSALGHQINVEGYGNTGIVLLRIEGTFRFLARPETFRNIRVLCVLEDINRYLPRLLADATIMKNVH